MIQILIHTVIHSLISLIEQTHKRAPYSVPQTTKLARMQLFRTAISNQYYPANPNETPPATSTFGHNVPSWSPANHGFRFLRVEHRWHFKHWELIAAKSWYSDSHMRMRKRSRNNCMGRSIILKAPNTVSKMWKILEVYNITATTVKLYPGALPKQQ